MALAATSFMILATSGIALANFHAGDATFVHENRTVDAGKQVKVTIACPDRHRVISGGAYWHRQGEDGDPSLYAILNSSAPATNTRGWLAIGTNKSDEDLVLTVQAFCLADSEVPAYHVITKDRLVAAHTHLRAVATCDDGDAVVTGGAVWHRANADPTTGLSVRLSTSLPVRGAWDAAGDNTGSTDLHLRVTALCRPASSLPSNGEDEVAVRVLFGQSRALTATCPAPDHVVGGGAFWAPRTGQGGPEQDDTIQGTILDSAPTGDQSAWYVSAKQTDGHYRSAWLWVVSFCYTP